MKPTIIRHSRGHFSEAYRMECNRCNWQSHWVYENSLEWALPQIGPGCPYCDGEAKRPLYGNGAHVAKQYLES